MLNRSMPYRFLVRILGVLLFLVALFYAFRVATQAVQEVYADRTDVRLLIEIDPTFVFLILVHQGISFIGAVGLLLLGLSFRRAPIAYWSLQLVVWLAGISLWYASSELNPFPVDPTWIVVTALCSFVLLVLYIPVIHLFRWLLERSATLQRG